MKTKIKYLFEGDSLTSNGLYHVDCSLGNSYPKYAAQRIIKKFPDIEFEFYNEGIFGSKTKDLLNRLPEELEKYKPDVVSIFIGVNDAIGYKDANLSFKGIKRNYIKIVELVKKSGAKLIIVEPYLLPKDIYNRQVKRKYLIKVNEIIKNIAIKYADCFIPLDGLLFSNWVNDDPMSYTVDGLHENDKGAKEIGKLYAPFVCNLIRKMEKKS